MDVMRRRGFRSATILKASRPSRWSAFVLAGLVAFSALQAQAQLSLRKVNRHGVTVTVIPNDVGAQSQMWEFLIAFDSHLLGWLEKLPRSAVLVGPHKWQEVDIEWEAVPPGRFHRQGMLRFAPIDPPPQSIEVRIAMPGEAKPRVFRWTLK